MVAKWLKRWTTDSGVPGSSPTIATGIFHLGVYSALPKKVSRCSLKVLPPEVYTASFRQDVKPLVPGDLVEIGSCLLQVLVSHYCGQPLRGNKKQKQQKNNVRTLKASLVPRTTLFLALWFVLTILHGSGREAKNGEGLGELITVTYFNVRRTSGGVIQSHR